MRESRTYGSGRGACDETHVPTATTARVHHAARRRGGGVAARGARAAAGPVRQIGMLMPYREHDAEIQARIAVFRQGLRKLGWTEGDNIAIDDRWSADNMDRIRRHAAELVRLEPDVILVVRPPRRRPIVQRQPAPSRSCSWASPIRSAPVWSKALPGRAATHGIFTISNSQLERKAGWSCSGRSRPASPAWRSCQIPTNPGHRPLFTIVQGRRKRRRYAVVVFPVLTTPAEIERAIEAFAREPQWRRWS